MSTVHTGIGYGAVKPSGKTVRFGMFASFGYIQPGQYSYVEVVDVLATGSAVEYATAQVRWASAGQMPRVTAPSMAWTASAQTAATTHQKVAFASTGAHT